MIRGEAVETAFRLMKWACLPVAGWPLPLNPSPSMLFHRKVAQWCGLVNLTITEAGLFYAMVQHSNNIDAVVLLVTELFACFSIHIKIIISRNMSHDLQVLFHRMDEFVKSAKREDAEVVGRIFERCAFVHGVMLMTTFIGATTYVIAPAFSSSQILPIATEYPFSIASSWVWSVCYISQSWATFQVSSTSVMDITCAIPLWYVVARFRILSAMIRRSKNSDDIERCVANHIELLEYVDLLRPVARTLAAATAFVTMICATCVGFLLIRHPPLPEMVKFVCLELVATAELFVYSWPANDLIDASEEIGDAAASCEWIGKSPRMRRDIILMIQRSRKPIFIRFAGILPVLSLEFYASTISANVSYLTALRAITDGTN